MVSGQLAVYVITYTQEIYKQRGNETKLCMGIIISIVLFNLTIACISEAYRECMQAPE